MDPRRSERIVREVSADVERVAGGRFVVKSFIGAGSYGEVCGGVDLLTGRRVAIKRVATCLQHGTRKAILKDVFLAKRVLREVALLTHFSHPNILSLHALCVPPPTEPLPPGSPPATPHPAAFTASPPHGPEGHPLSAPVQAAAKEGKPVAQNAGPGGFACGAGDLMRAERMFLVTDLMDTDLQSIIRSGQQLSVDHVSYFTFQVLLALKALHDARVMHRDLHPANVLLSLEHDVKLCDFNLCREEAPVAARAASAGDGGDAMMSPAGEAAAAGGEGEDGQPPADLTDYVTSRWYRAPELVMQWRQYNRAVDLWSLGCLMAEMFRGCPLFRGSTFYQQLDTIVRVIGRPAEEEVAHIGTPAARRYLYRNPDFANIVPRDLRTVVPNASDTAIDLLEKLLVFHPDKRITVDEALKHPFYAAFCASFLATSDLYHPRDLPLPHPIFEKDADIEALKTPEEICAALEQYVLALAGDDYRRNSGLQPPAAVPGGGVPQQQTLGAQQQPDEDRRYAA